MMSKAPMKQADAPATEPQQSKLPAPHFDELAVLIAQPVEPIPSKRDWFAVLEKPRMILGMIIVAALLGSTALALTLQLQRQPRVETAIADVPAEASGIEAETPLGAQIESEASPEGLPANGRLKSRRIRSRIIPVPTRPVARRVGVIYGSSDHP